jgi:hypothetical protein
MTRGLLGALRRILRAVGDAIRRRPVVFGLVFVGVFALNLGLPVVVLSLARKPVDAFMLNPWLARLPEYLMSGRDPLSRKVAFLADMALAWFIANNPIEGVEWGFIIDVPSLARFLLTAWLFAAFAVLWLRRREQVAARAWEAHAVRYGGAGGLAASVLGFSTGACSVMGCGVPVLPVVGLALTGVSSGVLPLLAQVSRVATLVVLVAMTAAVVWFAWITGQSVPPLAARAAER